MKNKYILFVGATGVGKSAIIDKIQEKLNRTIAVYSDPFMNNPFITQSYVENQYTFQSQMFFFKEFLKIHNKISTSPEMIIFQERSIYESVKIFCKLYLESSKINLNEFLLFEELLQITSINFRKPDYIIHLTATPNIILNRIRLRNRSFEQKITEDFIKLQQTLYKQWLFRFQKEYSIPAINIDTSNKSIESIAEDCLQIMME